MKLYTECGATIYRGFFGKDEDGNHDECSNEIVVDMGDVHEDEVAEWEEDGDGWLGPVSVRCASCKSLLEWPQRWEETTEDEEPRGYV